MKQYHNTWGLFPCFVEDGVDIIHPDDLDWFQPSNTRVFNCKDFDNEYLTLQFNDSEYKVKPINYQVIDEPKFTFNSHVIIRKSGYPGTIKEIHWHYKDNRHFYLLSVDGKKSSKRFSEEDLL